MASTSKTNKRKSLASGNESNIQVSIGEASSQVGPAFVNFPSVRPAAATPFTIYRKDGDSTAEEFSKQSTMIAGETADVEFFSINRDGGAENLDYQCQYLPALYDPSTSSLTFAPSTPTYLLTHTVKRLRLQAAAEDAKAATNFQERLKKRNDLGEAFGTRKAKSRIKEEERNKVDARAQEGARGHMMETILEKAGRGKTDEEKATLALSQRLIPPPNMTTNDPSEVYARKTIIPDEEWALISTSELLKTTDDRERMALLPYRSSGWIEEKMRVAVEGSDGSKRKTALKLLYYISCMRSVLKNDRALSTIDSATLASKFNNMPKLILDSLILRFAERSGSKTSITTASKTKLLSYMFALILMVENFVVDTSRIADDLSMPPTKVHTLFKQLGCTVDVATVQERELMGLTLKDAQKARKAVLHAPPKFPKEKSRGPVKR